MSTDPNILLAQQISAGNRKAFRQLYESCWKELFLHAFHLLASEELAKDFTQDAFVKLWNKRHHIDTSLSPRPYLYTILKNNIINHLRKEKMQELKKADIVRKAFTEGPSPADHLEAKELEKEIEAGIRSMPPAMQRIWRMSRQEHLPVDEIARKLDISPLTVKKQLCNALNVLRSRIAARPDK